MGLDMYLEAEFYVKNWDFRGAEGHTDVTVIPGGQVNPHIDTTKISKIICEVGYWRKANQIHGWFVRECQEGRDECQRTYVERSKLAELLNLVQRVQANHTLANELLPPTSGFFFGDYSADAAEHEWYWEDLKETEEILSALDLDGPAECDFYYHSSW